MSESNESDRPLEAGALIDARYRVVRVLGVGGMGRVYEAVDETLDRRVALKLMRPLPGGAGQRFEREARVAAGLTHPSVVRIYGFGALPDGRRYLVMEFIDGRPLSVLLREDGPVSPRRAVQLMRPVAGALAEAHAAGIVHRDLKPENLVLQRAAGMSELVRLIDFGIASVDLPEGERLTQTGAVFGTPEFMAPEQALGKRVSPATDVWSMGAVLHALVTRDGPFTGEHAPAILIQVVREPPAPLPTDVPEDFRALVEACLTRDPAERPADAGELLSRLDALVAPVPTVVSGPQVSPEPPSAPLSAPGRLPEASRVTSSPSRPSIEPTVRPLRPPSRRASRPTVLFGATLCGLLVVWLGWRAFRAEPADAEAEAVATLAATAAEAEPPPEDAGASPDAATALEPAVVLLEKGEAEAALAWLEAHPDVGGARGLLLRALARLEAGQVAEGLTDLKAALAGEPNLARDARVLPAVLEVLGHRKGEQAVALLAGPLLERAAPRLLELAGDRRYRTRWRAVEALEKAGRDVRAAKVAAYRKDTWLRDCDMRRRAVVQLGRLGDPAAIPDVRRVGNMGFFKRMCFDDEVKHALRALAKAKKAAEP